MHHHQSLCVCTRRGRGLCITSHNFDPVHLGQLRVLPELHLLEHEGPHIVTEAVGVQLVRLKVELGLDPGGEGGVDGLVELDEDPECEGGAEHLQLQELVQALLQRVAQRGVAVQLVRHLGYRSCAASEPATHFLSTSLRQTSIF